MSRGDSRQLYNFTTEPSGIKYTLQRVKETKGNYIGNYQDTD